MAKVLHVDSSASLKQSTSRQLTQQFLEQWRRQHPQDQIVKRDIVNPGLPHLDEATIGAFFTPPENRSPEQEKTIQLSETLVDELLDADVVVLSAPMYNFSIPSTLKAYIDHVVRAGKTFAYGANGPQGLAQDKKVYVILTSGGDYKGLPIDFQEPYLKHILGFIGITDVTFIQAAGLAMGEEAKAKGLQNASGQIEKALDSSLPRAA